MGMFLSLHAGSAITWSAALRAGSGTTARRAGPSPGRHAAAHRDGHAGEGGVALRQKHRREARGAPGRAGDRVYREGRASAGAPPVASVDEFMRRAPLMLVASGKPFEYPQTNWGDTVQMIGPCMFEPAMDTVPDWLTAIDRPIVLVTTSSQQQADA